MTENKEHYEISELAEEIREYLLNHPNAADSLEGIAKWWLARQRYERARARVEQALELLISQGAVKKTLLKDQVSVYSLAESSENRGRGPRNDSG